MPLCWFCHEVAHLLNNSVVQVNLLGWVGLAVACGVQILQIMCTNNEGLLLILTVALTGTAPALELF